MSRCGDFSQSAGLCGLIVELTGVQINGSQLAGIESVAVGRKDDDKQANPAQWRLILQDELSRLGSLSVPQLASEVMVKGFAHGDQADSEEVWLSSANISIELYPPKPVVMPPPEDVKLIKQIERLVAEGLQELEHASLVRPKTSSAAGSHLNYTTTRAGHSALENGEVQEILARRKSESA